MARQCGEGWIACECDARCRRQRRRQITRSRLLQGQRKPASGNPSPRQSVLANARHARFSEMSCLASRELGTHDGGVWKFIATSAEVRCPTSDSAVLNLQPLERLGISPSSGRLIRLLPSLSHGRHPKLMAIRHQRVDLPKTHKGLFGCNAASLPPTSPSLVKNHTSGRRISKQ